LAGVNTKICYTTIYYFYGTNLYRQEGEMKLYREVKASERLPEETNYYNTDNGSGLFSVAYFIADDEDFKDTWRENEHLVWLEPIEITEEEIRGIIHEDPDGGYWTIPEQLRLARAILSKLKGE